MQVVEQLDRLSEEHFIALYETLSENGYGPLDREVALELKFRPKAIAKLPMAKRARRARHIIKSRNDSELAYELIGGYLMKKSRELITDFLDRTGVAHEDGMIEDLDRTRPAPEKLETVLAELDLKYDPADVTMYLSMCATQWPESPELDAAWRARLAVAGA